MWHYTRLGPSRLGIKGCDMMTDKGCLVAGKG